MAETHPFLCDVIGGKCITCGLLWHEHKSGFETPQASQTTESESETHAWMRLCMENILCVVPRHRRPAPPLTRTSAGEPIPRHGALAMAAAELASESDPTAPIGVETPQASPEPSARLIEVLRAQRNQAQASLDRAVKILAAIHGCIYPDRLKLPDGRTMMFQPENPHEYLQAVADRIRAIPDEIAAQAKGAAQAPIDELASRITAYLAGGGLFNPEMADHTAVRDLLIDCRESLLASRAEEAPQAPPRAMEADEWAELYRLRAEATAPDGYATWKDAAIAERMRRVKAEGVPQISPDERAAFESLLYAAEQVFEETGGDGFGPGDRQRLLRCIKESVSVLSAGRTRESPAAASSAIPPDYKR